MNTYDSNLESPLLCPLLVAVKIQRPDMLVSITLDLYIIRSLLLLGQAFPVIAEECKGEVVVLIFPHCSGRCRRATRAIFMCHCSISYFPFHRLLRVCMSVCPSPLRLLYIDSLIGQPVHGVISMADF